MGIELKIIPQTIPHEILQKVRKFTHLTDVILLLSFLHCAQYLCNIGRLKVGRVQTVFAIM